MSLENAQESEDEGNVPFSQDETKITEASKSECIAEMRRLVEAEPDKFLSRNYFRVHSRLAESAWSCHFGTFAEFKKAANVTPSRHVQNLERQIAKHASVDSYRKLGVDRLGWEDRYQAPEGGRFQTHLIATDIHDIDCDPFFRRVLMETLQRVQPTRFILGGDTFDLAEFGKYSTDPRDWDVVGRIRWVHEFLAEARRAAPNARIDMLEGNHEFRLMRHLAEASTAMRAVLSDLHGFTVPKLLGLEQFEVNYHAKADLATFHQKDMNAEIRRNYLIVDNAFLVHHFPEGQAMGFPGVHGHHHKHIVWPHYSPHFGSFEWHQLGAGHRRQASYCAGEKWANGFVLAHVDTHTKHTAWEYIDIRDHAVAGGRWYIRDASEV